MTTMKMARRMHRAEYLRRDDYTPFRVWARANAERFVSPSPKLARIIGGGR